MKKIVSIVMIFALLLSLSVIPAAAVETDQETRMAKQGEIIPKNVAEVLAEMFVQSNVDSGMETSWNTGTEVLGTVTLYDEKGLPSAYSVELKTNGSPSGYVIISAYPDMENYILEYADAIAPLYDEFDPDETDQIVYTGNLQYYQETEDNILLDLQGAEVSAEDIVNVFDEIRDEEAIEDARVSAQEAYAASTPQISLFASGGKDGYGTIVNPTEYIAAKYGDADDMKVHEWKSLESYTRHRTMNSFASAYPGRNHGPTAIANIVEITGNLRNISTIKNTSIQSIYNTIEEIGIGNMYFTNTPSSSNQIPAWTEKVLAKYGVKIHSSQLGYFSYETIKNELNKNRPFILSVTQYGTYFIERKHTVAVYAYTRFHNKKSGNYKSFVKVADGYSNSGRYIDMISIVNQSVVNAEIFTIEYQ